MTGNRFLRGLVVPGGARLDLLDDLLGGLTATLQDTLAGLDSLMGRIEANPSVVDRLDDTGILQRQAAWTSPSLEWRPGRAAWLATRAATIPKAHSRVPSRLTFTS